MFNSKSFNCLKRISSGCKSSSENVEQLFIKTSDSHIFYSEIRSEDTFLTTLGGYTQKRSRSSFDIDLSLREKSSKHACVTFFIISCHHVQTFCDFDTIGDAINNDIFFFTQVEKTSFFFLFENL